MCASGGSHRRLQLRLTLPAAVVCADPFALPPQKSLEKIGVALQDQYTQWQPRVRAACPLPPPVSDASSRRDRCVVALCGLPPQARYKILMDPTVDHVRKLCMSLRRLAKEDRVLFHYNGHGVPRPTSNGEVWMFNPVRCVAWRLHQAQPSYELPPPCLPP